MGVFSDATHKYLGRIYAGDLTKRRHVGFQQFGPSFINLGPCLQTNTFQSNCI